MPTECERSVTSSVTTKISSSNEIKDNNSTITTTSSSISFNEDLQTSTTSTTTMMEGGDMSTSQTSTTSNGSSSCNGGGRKTSITSPDPTAYVAKARVTRPTPPPPPYNPMQFVQIKPCNLYQTAQEQLKKAEEVKKIKEIRKEEPEDWQNNLDNWKSSRRKRVEHIIDRVVEVKKLELEEHDRTRRKSKTFSEMIEERGERAGGRGLNKLVSLAVYAEDESNDLSDLGIGTSSASGKSSLSEDYDNNSVMSDNAAELDKAITNSTHHKPATDSTTREYISSPGYETSSSTAPASSPDPCEYTYEGAIQDYKQRVSRAASGLTAVALNKLTQHNQTQQNSKESTPERGVVKETATTTAAYPPRRGSKIEDRLMGFEVQSPSSEECVEKSKVDVPKIDISKRKEIFEQQQQLQQQQQQQALQTNEPKSSQLLGHQTNTTVVVPRVTLRDRFKDTRTEKSVTEQPKKELKRLSGDITSIKERLQSLEQQQNLVNGGANGAIKATANKLVDIPVPPLKERLSSLQNAVTKEEIRKPPVVLVDARQLEIMKVEEEKAQQSLKETKEKEKVKEKEKQPQSETVTTTATTTTTTEQLQKETNKIVTEETEETDRDDSGIHTADDVELDEQQQQRLQVDQMMKKEQELKLNAAIEALAKEEQQLSEAANVVNQIEAEFEELTLASVATLPPLAGTAANTTAASSSSASASATPITNDHMEYSVSSTNPLATKSISSSSSSSTSPTTPLNHNETSCTSSSLISDNNGTDSGTGTSTGAETEPSGKGNHNNNEVKVLDIKSGGAATNLRRKPTNEMVHAKNLLKIFKETFQNDSELDLEEQQEQHMEQEHETKAIVSDNPCDDKLGLNIKTQIYENSSNRNEKEIETTPQSPKLSNIPRTMTPHLVGKPPMSPQSSRSAVRFVSHTPPGSPALARKNDSQFSINGRVEIFNSKTMTSPIKSPPVPYTPTTPTSPTVTTKRTQMPHIRQTAVATTAPSNNILLPQSDNTTAIKQQQQQQITTVIEPLATLQQQQQQQQHQQQMKSMPAQRMVNEPKTTAMVDDCKQTQAVKHQQQQQQLHQANHVDDDDDDDDDNKQLVKQQQQQHQPEVVVCAPPITIVNPDELPKPNTVKNLSSCFQQKDNNASSNSVSSKPIVPPKPLPRSRIPQATPPQTPLLPRRHMCYSSSPLSSNEEQQNTATTTPPSVEDNKKLSLISCSSNSSSSTDTTVIENDKKLSILSQTSTTSSSSDNNPTLVKTNAQVHQQPIEKEQEPEQIEKTESSKEIVERPSTPKESIDEPDCKPAKTLDKPSTQALVEEMIKDEAKNRALALNIQYKAPLAPLKPNPESPIDELETPIVTLPSNDSPKTPVKTPTSPVFSNKTELFKTTKPLVVSTLYDKYQQEDPLPLAVPNNQRPIDKSSTKSKPVEPLPLPLIIPAELPNLPDCPPNESTLYKLANSAPHSPSSPRSNKSDNSLQNPSSPSTNSEKNLAIDSAICNSLLASLAATPDMLPLQRQHTVEEDLCQKVDKDTLPFHQGSTGFKDVTKSDIKRCDGLTPSSASKLHGVATQRQKTVEEELCQKLDVHSLPDGKQQPKTGFKCVSPTEIRKCDNFFGLGAAKPNSKPSSPIMEARAAHSKALIETCEKIIAEEKQANNQLKSSLPVSPVGTPVMQRKSKIPLPISSCLSCKATESLNEADLRQQNKELSSSSPTKEENNGVIARMHVVETQIKVTTTTPPASPNITTKTQASPQTQKKTKNIFDFLKKNFGGSSPNHKEDQTAEAAKEKASQESSPKVLILSEQELQDLEKVKYDEIHKFDNSKFYLPSSHDIGVEQEEDGLTATPPPLPKTPAPVNIEITRKIITDEILEDDKTEQQLTQEIDDLLDDELNKLNHEIEELEKAGQRQ